MDNKQFPENIRQAVDLISAVLRRIKVKRLALTDDPRLIVLKKKGVTA